MSDTSSSGRFPRALRSAAAARWSHRDPVEAGNPFPPEDERHQTWNAATRRAKDALARMDEQLDAAEKTGAHPDPYPVRLVALAEARFDVWAARLLAVVQGPEALADYEAWLSTYVANWLAYVADTCPRVAVADALRERLSARVRHWVVEAGEGRNPHQRPGPRERHACGDA